MYQFSIGNLASSNCTHVHHSLLQADEFVVFSPHQQRMRYLVEFTLPDEDNDPESGEAVYCVGSESSRAGEGSEDEEEISQEGTCTHSY